MSAYIVTHTTIQNVLSGLALLEKETGFAITREFAKIGDKTEIGRALLRLNELSVYARYPDALESRAMGESEADLFTYRESMPCPRIQAFKSAECLLYQSGEGIYKGAILYLLLAQLTDTLARFIVRRLPEYEKAPWG